MRVVEHSRIFNKSLHVDQIDWLGLNVSGKIIYGWRETMVEHKKFEIKILKYNVYAKTVEKINTWHSPHGFRCNAVFNRERQEIGFLLFNDKIRPDHLFRVFNVETGASTCYRLKHENRSYDNKFHESKLFKMDLISFGSRGFLVEAYGFTSTVKYYKIAVEDNSHDDGETSAFAYPYANLHYISSIEIRCERFNVCQLKICACCKSMVLDDHNLWSISGLFHRDTVSASLYDFASNSWSVIKLDFDKSEKGECSELFYGNGDHVIQFVHRGSILKLNMKRKSWSVFIWMDRLVKSIFYFDWISDPIYIITADYASHEYVIYTLSVHSHVTSLQDACIGSLWSECSALSDQKKCRALCMPKALIRFYFGNLPSCDNGAAAVV